MAKVEKTDAEWRAQLSDLAYKVTRKAGTERAFTGEYWDHKEHGIYVDVVSGEPLFSSLDKYDSVSEAVQELFRARVDIVWTWPNSKIFSMPCIRAILLTSARNRIPVFGFSMSFVRSGGLMGVGIEPETQGYQVAELTRRVLAIRKMAEREERPGEKRLFAFSLVEPIVEDPRYVIVLNKIVARNMGIEFPSKLIKRAGFETWL